MAGTRKRVAAAALAALLALGGAGAATEAKPKPRKPKPKLELMTTTQEGALARKAIKVAVNSKRGREARLRGTLFVDGFPDDYHFRLGPKTKRLRGGEATFALPLSARKREVLDFAAQTCRPASVDLAVKVGRGRDALDKRLRKPNDCRS
jgi:hypothetical protein